MLGVVSILVGLIFGVLCSLIFKHFRFMTVSPIIETFIIFSLCLTAYFTSELLHIAGIQMSGIISLLTAGIFNSHYTYYNLSAQGKQSACLTFSFLGEMCEAAVYSYVGIALYAMIPTWWSFSFIFIQLGIIIAGRIFGVLCTFYTCRCCWKKKTINFWELIFITYAGMIRGAIALALVLKIPYVGSESCADPEYCYTEENYELVVSTTLTLVMLTTLLFGTFMDPVQKWLVPPKKEPEPDQHPFFGSFTPEMMRRSPSFDYLMMKSSNVSVGHSQRAEKQYVQIEDVDAGKKVQHNSDEHTKPRFGSDDIDVKA